MRLRKLLHLKCFQVLPGFFVDRLVIALGPIMRLVQLATIIPSLIREQLSCNHYIHQGFLRHH
jgi:hypothetical protein